MNPNEPQMLSDEELSKVAGGYAYWNIDRENHYQCLYKDNRSYQKVDYETWIPGSPGMDDDSRRCRLEWIAAGRPKNLQFTISDEGGSVWSCSFSFRDRDRRTLSCGKPTIG